jgi:hypothetical protein
MAKRETAVATVEPVETALATVPQDLLDAQGAGTEHVDTTNIRPPRLQICQSGSAQFKNTPKHIEGIREGDLFNSLTNEIYPKPLKFIVIQRLKTNYMQFKPGELGVVLDYDVPAGDPRTKPTLDDKGRWKDKPVATQFDNYLVLLPESLEILALSFKGTGLSGSRQLDSLLSIPLKIDGTIIPKPPAWAKTFTLSTADKSGKGQTWSTPVVTGAGVTPVELRLAAQSLYLQYQKVQVVLDHDEAVTDAPDDSDISF